MLTKKKRQKMHRNTFRAVNKTNFPLGMKRFVSTLHELTKTKVTNFTTECTPTTERDRNNKFPLFARHFSASPVLSVCQQTPKWHVVVVVVAAIVVGHLRCTAAAAVTRVGEEAEEVNQCGINKQVPTAIALFSLSSIQFSCWIARCYHPSVG